MSAFGDYERCSTCGEYGWGRTHKCPPRFRVWRPEHGEDFADAGLLYARDHEEAAERWAEKSDSDSAEYDIVGGEPAKVYVVEADGDEEHALLFHVEGEAQPVYHARQIEKDPSAPFRGR